jgi:hypothetical protein
MLYLTYNNKDHTDGAGSQIQRIISIYMIAKYYKIGYIHSPLYKLDYQGLKCLENNKEDNKQLNDYNNLINLPSDNITSIDNVYNVKYINEEIILQFKDIKKNTILMITYGSLVDINPNIMKIPINFPWIQSIKSDVLNVAIHIRRGELFVVDSNRMLPNSYYIECMTAIKNILDKNNIPFKFHLHTEVVTKEVNITPTHHGIINRIEKNIILKPTDNHLDDFSIFNNIEYHINEYPIDTFKELTNSDILIASRSSFSYVSSMLRKKGIVLFHPFWHSLNPEWIPVKNGVDIYNNEKIILEKLRD